MGIAPEPHFERFLLDFGHQWGPPREQFWALWASFWGSKKKSKKKMKKKSGAGASWGRPAECAGPLGRIMEGSKLSRKVQSRKVQSKQKRRSANQASGLTRSCHPAAEASGGGRIDHPQGGSTARPPFSAGPQRAVDIIWGCAVLGVLCYVCCAVSAGAVSQGALNIIWSCGGGVCVCAFAGSPFCCWP